MQASRRRCFRWWWSCCRLVLAVSGAGLRRGPGLPRALDAPTPGRPQGRGAPGSPSGRSPRVLCSEPFPHHSEQCLTRSHVRFKNLGGPEQSEEGGFVSRPRQTPALRPTEEALAALVRRGPAALMTLDSVFGGERPSWRPAAGSPSGGPETSASGPLPLTWEKPHTYRCFGVLKCFCSTLAELWGSPVVPPPGDAGRCLGRLLLAQGGWGLGLLLSPPRRPTRPSPIPARWFRAGALCCQVSARRLLGAWPGQGWRAQPAGVSGEQGLRMVLERAPPRVLQGLRGEEQAPWLQPGQGSATAGKAVWLHFLLCREPVLGGGVGRAWPPPGQHRSLCPRWPFCKTGKDLGPPWTVGVVGTSLPAPPPPHSLCTLGPLHRATLGAATAGLREPSALCRPVQGGGRVLWSDAQQEPGAGKEAKRGKRCPGH